MISSNYGERGSLPAFAFIWLQSRKDNDLEEKKVEKIKICLFVLFLTDRHYFIKLFNESEGLKTSSHQNCD